MKKIANKMVIAGLMIACISLFSFKNIPGGDSFQVYLNGKLVLDKALYKYKEIQNLELPQVSANDKVEISYSHCGVTGKSRTITARDAQGKVLKTWHFADSDQRKMSIRLQDLKELQSNNKKSSISLYYSSKELTVGQQLVSVSVGNKSLAAR